MGVAAVGADGESAFARKQGRTRWQHAPTREHGRARP